MSKFEEVGAAARGRWQGILSRLGVRSDALVDRHGPCPGCGGRDRFRFDDAEGSGSWLCSQGGGGTISGDGFGLLGHVHGWEPARQLREVAGLLGIGMGDGSAARVEPMGSGVAPEPKLARGPKRPPFDLGKLEAFAGGCRERVSRAWLWERSPICPMWGVSQGVAPGFLSALYGPQERVLVFSDYYSQGDFLWCEGMGGGFRLSQDPRVRGVRSALPVSGPKGVWFLTNPVSGAWVPARGSGKLGRRHEGCVTAFRYAVLESDEAPPELWLRALALMDLRIAAVYSSGGRSIHALVRVDAGSKADFDGCRDLLARVLCPLGADGGALSGVRLSRLPGCGRGASGVQELWYLDADPKWGRLADAGRVREAPRGA